MDAEGATSQVTRVGEPISDVRWSPDGKSIGFSMFVPQENRWAIDMPTPPASGIQSPRLHPPLRRPVGRRHSARTDLG
jgi:hypothetical protein